MKTKYELFNQDMVKALLDGRKTQTRRPIKPQPAHGIEVCMYSASGFAESHPDGRCLCKEVKSKYQPGQIIGVRERARVNHTRIMRGERVGIFEYIADETETAWIVIPPRIKHIPEGHCVPNGCFKELVRIFLKVTKVRVERWWDISEADARGEGFLRTHTCKQECNPCYEDEGCTGLTTTASSYFQNAIHSIYPDSYLNNDWVFVYDFERCEKP